MATTFTATPEPPVGGSIPRTLLELTYTGQTEAQITRLDPDGAVRPVRLGEPAELDGAGSWVGYDYESWLGYPATYTATTGAGTLTAGPVTLTASEVWLRHPGIPSLSLAIDFQGEGEPTRAAVQAVLEPLGRTYPIVVTDGRRKSKRGVITIRTATAAEAQALLDLVDDTSVLLLDIPATRTLQMDAHQYLALGDLTQGRRRPDYYPDPHKIWTAPYIAVDRPAGGLQSERTWDTLLTDFASWNAARAAYASWNALLTG